MLSMRDDRIIKTVYQWQQESTGKLDIDGLIWRRLQKNCVTKLRCDTIWWGFNVRLKTDKKQSV